MNDDDSPPPYDAPIDGDPLPRVRFASLLIRAFDYDASDAQVEHREDHGPNSDYTITASDKQAPIQCPVPTCSVTVKGGGYAIRRHFLFRHHNLSITVSEEGTLPRCRECGFQCALPHAGHQRSHLCTNGRARNLRRLLSQPRSAARHATNTVWYQSQVAEALHTGNPVRPSVSVSILCCGCPCSCPCPGKMPTPNGGFPAV